ncbi:MAG: hypothetical protein IKV60_01745 [Rikenellaceae bacterium]|nr:hypothetical protein [Rikenellaceae bacterium]
MRRGLIMIPYAYVARFNSGVNIGNTTHQVELYLRNCCVAAVSARVHCGESTDVAVVTNITVPSPYNHLLTSAGVKILTFPFDEFNFGGEYAWSLAFYKLCALSKAVSHLDYDYYACLDSDVYVQSSFDNIWQECDSHILLYDINHSLANADYRRLLGEVEALCADCKGVTHYGGEFYAASATASARFVEECAGVYSEMTARGFKTSQGDEFITAIAAHRLRGVVKNAGAYVCRYWTGTFRLVSSNYKHNPVVVLHCPAEKQSGMLALYNRYIRRGRIPSPAVAHRLLHLRFPSAVVILKIIVKKIFKTRIWN